VAQRLASGAALEIFDTLDSTSLEARRRVEDGRFAPAFIVALTQTAGYGRRGAAWFQSGGDFAGTLVFDDSAPRERIGELSLIAGLAVIDALARFAPPGELRLKWPNDVLLAGRKVAGILLELLAVRAGRAILSLGVGVNVVSRPEIADYPTARLLDAGAESVPTPAELARALDETFDECRSRWRRDGFAPIRSAWLEKAAGVGRKIVVRIPDGEFSGVFRDLDPAGALILECDDGERRIHAGSIVSGLGA